MSKFNLSIDDVLFRASSIGDLCGVKGLGKTGEKRARYTYLEYKTGRTKEFTSQQTEKGTKTEPISIDLINKKFDTNYTKNETRLSDEYFTGECDIYDESTSTIIDVKGSFDVFTHDDNVAGYEFEIIELS